jgi:hypothetical protein
MTKPDIQAIRDRHQADEVWELSTCDDGVLMIATPGDVVCISECNHPPGDEWDAKNFAAIVADHQDIPALLSYIGELEAENARLKTALEFYADENTDDGDIARAALISKETA